ncbi:MAG: hypothetical protein ACK4UJ_11595 [Leptonema sp. (in: bacteria)]
MVRIIFIFFTLLLISCKKDSNNPLLSLLFNNKITLLLKGTYATDRPLKFEEINNNQIFVDSVTSTEPIDTTNVPPYNSLPIYLDIGEVRLSTKAPLLDLSLIQSEQDSQKFWDVLSPNRQVFCNQLYTYNSELNSCLKNNGIVGFELMMNGEGVIFPSRDVGSGTYFHSGIFFRSVFFGYAKLGGNDSIGKFDNQDVIGIDVLRFLNYDPGVDSGSIALLPPQMFPLHYKVYPGTENVQIFQEYVPTIIEIRFNLKENLMLHAFQDTNSGQYLTYVGISDWRKNHSGQVYTGGNLLSRMRMIYPSLSNTLQVFGGTYTGRHYYALYYRYECSDGSCNKDVDLLPLSATPVRNGSDNFLKDIMPGSYFLQCRYDEIYDGYPEKVLSEIPVEITERNQNIQIQCNCGYSTSSGC